METTDLVELLRVLREHGVTRYETPELKLELGAATFAPTAGPPIEHEVGLNDVERELKNLAANRAFDSLPPQYRALLRDK